MTAEQFPHLQNVDGVNKRGPQVNESSQGEVVFQQLLVPADLLDSLQQQRSEEASFW